MIPSFNQSLNQPHTPLTRNRLLPRMIAGLATLAVCLSASLPASAAGLYASFQSPLVFQVEKLFEKQQPQRALELLEARGEKLNQAQYHGLRCQAFASLKDADSAIAACSQAIKFSKLNKQWIDHSNLGAAYLYTGELEKAQVSFKNALKINRTAKSARHNLRLTEKVIAARRLDKPEAMEHNNLAQK